MAKNSFEGFPKPRPNKGGTNTGDATAAAGDILTTKSAYVLGVKVNGTMPNNGATSFSPSTSSQPIPAGFYNGSGVVNPVTGTAVVGDVVSGKTFASGNGIGITGTIPAKTGDNVASAINGTSTVGRLYMQPTPNSYWPASGFYTYFDDPDFVAANIPSGMNMFGLVGNGGNVKRWATGTLSPTSNIFNITGLGFIPTKVFYYQIGNSTSSNVNGVSLVYSSAGDVSFYGNATQGLYNGILVTTKNVNPINAPTFTGNTLSNIMITAYGGEAVPIRWYAFD